MILFHEESTTSFPCLEIIDVGLDWIMEERGREDEGGEEQMRRGRTPLFIFWCLFGKKWR